MANRFTFATFATAADPKPPLPPACMPCMVGTSCRIPARGEFGAQQQLPQLDFLQDQQNLTPRVRRCAQLGNDHYHTGTPSVKRQGPEHSRALYDSSKGVSTSLSFPSVPTAPQNSDHTPPKETHHGRRSWQRFVVSCIG